MTTKDKISETGGRTFMLIACGTALAFLAAFPQVASAAMTKGVQMSTGVLIPALLPSMVICELLAQMAASELKNRRVLIALCVFVSLFGGYLSGARLISGAVCANRLERKTASDILCAAVNPGAAFCIAAVGGGMLASAELGVYLFISTSAASLLVLLLKIFGGKLAVASDSPPATLKKSDFFSCLSSALKSVAMICALSCLFSLAHAILALVLGESVARFAAGALEITSGCMALCEGKHAAYLCAGALSLCSVSVTAQVYMLAKPARISLQPFLLSRILHLAVTLGVFELLVKLSKTDVSAMSNARPTVVAAFSLSPMFSALMLLCCVAIICAKKQ